MKFIYAQERCVRLAGRLMQEKRMLHPGARVGVAVSGGVDSWVLLQVLHIRRRIVPFPFDLMVLHVNPGFPDADYSPLTEWLRTEGIAGHLEYADHGPRAHSPENRKRSACFYCAMLRRKRLFDLCAQYNLTHLAFGHTADDLLSSFLMNLTQNGRVEGMSLKEPFFKGALSVIRPLMLVEKKLIIKAARQWKLPIWSNACPSSENTRRSEVLADLDLLCGNDKTKRRTILNAVIRHQLDATE